MSNYLTEDLLEFEGLSEVITLEPKLIEQALQQSNQIRNQSRRWQIYLQALALFSFQEWLQKREPELPIHHENCSVFQLQYANVIDAVCHLTVGEFKVCLIPTICFSDEEVMIPRAVIDLPELAAHFYVVIGIEEDLEIAAIRGFVRYDQLVSYQPELEPDMDWNYPLPIAWFNRQPDELLLYLQCLETAAMPLPEIPNNRQGLLSQMQSELAVLLPQLHEHPLWKVLSWEQGKAVLTSPDLLNWLYQASSENSASLTNYLSDLLNLLTEEAVNVSVGLRNQMDNLVKGLSWQVLPAPSLRLKSDRSMAGQLEDILQEIKGCTGMEIPSDAGRAYQDLPLTPRLRLYAITWSVPDVEREWALLLVLGAVPGDLPPYGVKLRVSDQTGILSEEELKSDSNDAYLFTQVEGTYEEKFLATITSANGEAQISRLFEFCPELPL